jgi:hypothetical protein
MPRRESQKRSTKKADYLDQEKMSDKRHNPLLSGSTPERQSLNQEKVKKGWRDYLFEFFMVFLAITLGFFVENMREDISDRKIRKEYSYLIYRDLKTDFSELSKLIDSNKSKNKALRGITNCHVNLSKDITNTNCLCELVKYSKSNREFQMADRAMRQLTNAGGFRFLSVEDADSIGGYEILYRRYKDFESTLFQETQVAVRNTWNQIAEFGVNVRLPGTTKSFEDEYTSILGLDNNDKIITEPVLFSRDKGLVNQFFNELTLYLRANITQMLLLQGLREKAKTLIGYYEKKYHFI